MGISEWRTTLSTSEAEHVFLSHASLAERHTSRCCCPSYFNAFGAWMPFQTRQIQKHWLSRVHESFSTVEVFWLHPFLQKTHLPNIWISFLCLFLNPFGYHHWSNDSADQAESSNYTERQKRRLAVEKREKKIETDTIKSPQNKQPLYGETDNQLKPKSYAKR